MAVKRRTIWVDDGDWAHWEERRLDAGATNISQWLRWIAAGAFMAHIIQGRKNPRPFTPVPKPKRK